MLSETQHRYDQNTGRENRAETVVLSKKDLIDILRVVEGIKRKLLFMVRQGELPEKR